MPKQPTLRTRRQRSGRITTYSTFSGMQLAFGPPDDPLTRSRFAAALLAWEQAGRRVTRAVLDAAEGRQTIAPDSESGIPVRELAGRFLAFLGETGRYCRPGETTSSHLANIQKALGEFVEQFGDLPVARVTAAVLHQHRDRLERNVKLTRQGINRKVAFVVAAFRWGWKRGLVPKATWADLKLVEPLSRVEAGHRPQGFEKRIPTLDEIRRVVACCSRQVGGLIRLQTLTGMRPGEACSIRFEDVERITHDGATFGLYRVRQAKTAHHGHATSYVLPAPALAILDEFRRPGGGYVFRPSDAMRERGTALRAARKTKPTKQTLERDARPGREFGDVYDVMTYRQAIERACRAAGIERFVPHALRHVVASWAANHARLGIGAAAAALSHANRATTEHYVHADDSLRFRVASLAAVELVV